MDIIGFMPKELNFIAKPTIGAIPIPAATINGFLDLVTSKPLPKPTNTSNSIPIG